MYLTQNSKMKKATVPTWNWTLPAYKSRTGLTTCPSAGSCGATGGCYALQGAYTWKNVFPKHETNLALTRDIPHFEEVIGDEIQKLSERNPTMAIRIHDAGDFYNLEYTLAWFRIARAHPGVKFYAYTKMVSMLRGLRSVYPSNLVIIFSEGGKEDRRIQHATDRHSRVFSSLEELEEAGYIDATEDDTRAWSEASGKIGLVYHGAKGKKWSTAGIPGGKKWSTAS